MTDIFRAQIINFHTYYTIKVRLLCHVLIWIIFMMFMSLNYQYNIHLPFQTSFFLAFRICISTCLTFYLICFLFPIVVSKNIYYVFFFPILTIVLWLFINKLSYLFGEWLEIDLDVLYKYLGKNPSPSFSTLFSISYILLNAQSVIFALSPFLFIKIISRLTQYYNINIKNEREKFNLEIEKTEIEKKFLLSQLNPHFLFNTLNNIYGLILTGSDSSAANAVINLSNIMKYTLYEDNSQKVKLIKEIEFIRNYFNINKLRYSADENIVLNIDIQQSIDDLEILPLITFVLLENAFKYGLRSKSDKYLVCDILIRDNIFLLVIKNDVAKIATEHEAIGGIGLKNIKKRLELFYPHDNKLQVINGTSNFEIFLRIHL